MAVEYRAGRERPYIARVYASGVRVPSRAFHTRAEAVAWESAARLAIKTGAEIPGERHQETGSAQTLADAARETTRAMLSGAFRTKQGKPYREQSVTEYEARLRLHVLPYIGGMRLSDIDRAAIIRMRESVMEDVSDATAGSATDALRIVLRRAVERGAIPTNPTHALPALVVKRRKAMFLTRDEAVALQARADAHDNPRIGMTVRLALATGMRRGELAALTWDNVRDGRVHIDAEMGNMRPNGKLGEPKSEHSARSIPLGLRTWELLNAQRADGYVVGKLPTTAWHDVRPPGMRFHDLRHTAATFWLAGTPGVPGLSVHAVADLLGHGDAALVLRLYGHALPTETNRAGEVMDAFIASGENVGDSAPLRRAFMDENA